MEYAELSDLTTSIIDCPHSTPKWTSEGIFVIRNYNLVNGRVDLSDASFVSEEEYGLRIRRGKPEAGDIVLSREAPIGNIGVIPEGLKCCLGQRVVLIKVDRDKYDPYFLALVLQSRSLQHQMHNASGTGTTVSNLRIPYIEKLRIPLIVRQSQESIVGIIKCINDKIDCCNDINDNLSKQGQAIFDELIVNGDAVFKKKLTDIAHFQNGLPMQKNRPLSGNGLPVLKIKELNQGYCDSSSERCRDDIDSSVLVDNGDVVFSWSGSLMARIWCGGKCGLNQHLFKVTSNSYPLWFYYYWLQYHMPDFVDIAANKATTMGHICRNHLEEATIHVPDQTTMEKVDAILTPLVKLQVKTMEEITQLSVLRDYLLPKLMSGEIDVSALGIPN